MSNDNLRTFLVEYFIRDEKGREPPSFKDADPLENKYFHTLEIERANALGLHDRTALIKAIVVLDARVDAERTWNHRLEARGLAPYIRADGEKLINKMVDYYIGGAFKNDEKQPNFERVVDRYPIERTRENFELDVHRYKKNILNDTFAKNIEIYKQVVTQIAKHAHVKGKDQEIELGL